MKGRQTGCGEVDAGAVLSCAVDAGACRPTHSPREPCSLIPPLWPTHPPTRQPNNHSLTEMTKAGIIDEMMNDTLDAAMDSEDLEEETEEQAREGLGAAGAEGAGRGRAGGAWCGGWRAWTALQGAPAAAQRWHSLADRSCPQTTHPPPIRWTRSCWRLRARRWSKWRQHRGNRSRWGGCPWVGGCACATAALGNLVPNWPASPGTLIFAPCWTAAAAAAGGAAAGSAGGRGRGVVSAAGGGQELRPGCQHCPVCFSC